MSTDTLTYFVEFKYGEEWISIEYGTLDEALVCITNAARKGYSIKLTAREGTTTNVRFT